MIIRAKAYPRVGPVDSSRVSKHGVIDGKAVGAGVYKVDDFVEKPSVEEASSNLVIASRYIFPPDIFDYIARTKPGKDGE